MKALKFIIWFVLKDKWSKFWQSIQSKPEQNLSENIYKREAYLFHHFYFLKYVSYDS